KVGDQRCARRRLSSKRNVVIVQAATLRGWFSRSGRGFDCWTAGFITASSADELHVGSVDFQRVSGLTVTVSPFLNPQTTLNIYRSATRKILRCCLSLPAPKCHAKPGGDVVVFPGVAIAAPFVSCQTETAHWGALWRVPQFRIAAEVADKNDFVERHLVL